MKKVLRILNESDKEITQSDLKNLESYADKLFKNVGIDVGFTKHFLERVNDPRNKKQITFEELARLFREEYAKWGKKISNLKGGAEAVLKDMQTDINVPFILKWDAQSKELDLVSKTIMRKKGFKSPDPTFAISEDAAVNAAGGGNIAGIGIGSKGEPGKAGPVVRRGKFAGNETFVVPSDLFHKARLSKRDKLHWESYIGPGEHSQAIREYARKNPYKSVVLEDEKTGAMCFARYGKSKGKK